MMVAILPTIVRCNCKTTTLFKALYTLGLPEGKNEDEEHYDTSLTLAVKFFKRICLLKNLTGLSPWHKLSMINSPPDVRAEEVCRLRMFRRVSPPAVKRTGGSKARTGTGSGNQRVQRRGRGSPPPHRRKSIHVAMPPCQKPVSDSIPQQLQAVCHRVTWVLEQRPHTCRPEKDDATRAVSV